MTEKEKREQWRMIFSQAQTEELREFPLAPLVSPLQIAKYEVAARFFAEKKSQRTLFDLELWMADDVSRQAFFDVLGFESNERFCLRNERANKLDGPRNRGSRFYLYTRCGHSFSELEGDELTQTWSWQAANTGGMGMADLWRFDGEKLIFVRNESAWVS